MNVLELLEGDTLRADKLAKCISEQIKYRFMCAPSVYLTVT